MALFLAECHELVVVIPAACFQFAPVLHHVNVLQLLVVSPDVILVAALPDIEYAPIGPVDIDDGGLPGLPVEVNMTGHRPLYDRVAHVEIVEVIARVTEHDALELADARFLVGEELILEMFFAKALMGIDGQGLQLSAPSGATSDTGLAELVDDTGLSCFFKQLDIHRASPIELIVFLPCLIASIDVDTNLRIVQVALVGGDADDGQCHLPRVENIALRDRTRRKPAITEQTGTHDLGIGNSQG